MDIEEYRQRFAEDSSPGRDAIDASLSEVYGDQEPKYMAPELEFMRGDDPLDGVRVYVCDQGGIGHRHFVTMGYTTLEYDLESVGNEHSGFGFEMTFRLIGQTFVAEETMWVYALMQNLAKYVFKSGKWFESYHWIPTKGPIRADYATAIVGLAFVYDPVLKSIDTPHGRVDFIQAFGITGSELDALKNNSRTCEEIVEHHRKSNPLLITDLDRTD